MQQAQQRLCERDHRHRGRRGYPLRRQDLASERCSTSLYHHFGGALPLLYESPQGVLDSKAPWSHEQIIDTCMFVVSQLCSHLME
jgi:hypothetical protein